MWFDMRRIKAAGFTLVLIFSLLASWPPAVRAESVTKMVERANAAVSRRDYPEAISLYEQARMKSPNDKTLTNNLSVLYANYGVFLQDQQDYDGAIRYYDKALSLTNPQSADARNVRASKASAYYAQALALRNLPGRPTSSGMPSAVPPATPDYARMKALIGQAIAINPNEPTYQRGLASVYLDEAYDLASRERYAEAAPLLEQAMTYDNESPSIRQSLANVYLGLARNDEARRQEWINKAMAVDNSPATRQAVDRLLAPPIIVPAPAPGKKGFAKPPGEVALRAPRDLAKLSVLEMLRDMEGQLGVTPAPGASLQERLEGVEKPVLGSAQTGPTAVRAKTVYVALMGTPQLPAAAPGVGASGGPGSGAQNDGVTPASPENSYLDRIFQATDGKVIRWGRFPLRVYVDAPPAALGVSPTERKPDALKSNPLYKPEFREAALAGLTVWKTATNGFTNFVEVKNPDAADIRIQWEETYVDRFAEPEKAAERYKHYVAPRQTKTMRVLQVASMVTPGYFSLAPQAVNAAMQYKEMKKLNVLREESVLHLGLAPTKDLSPEAARVLIQNMAAKEFGHALGLKGNSAQPGDLMYPDLPSDTVRMPTQRDLDTLRALYDRPANIVLNVH
jgi:predicted Zn-dependent protease/Tfp pilus assembly protein PilF